MPYDFLCTSSLYAEGPKQGTITHTAITIYRRHLKSCDVHNLNLPARAMRYYEDCKCPLWMYGRTDSALVPRQSTGLTDMKAAEVLRSSLMAEGKDQAIHGPRIDDCAEKYLVSRQAELGDKAQSQHKIVLDRLTKYCAQHGVHFMSELTVDLLEQFKVDGMPAMEDTSKSTYVAKLRCFLKDAFRREWLPATLVEKVKSHPAVYDQKSPYSNEEVDKILAGASAMEGGRRGYGGRPKTFRLLIEVMIETGMRVSDAVDYDPSAVVKGERLWIYSYTPHKDKKIQKVRTEEAYLTDRLKTAIDECKWFSTRRPFCNGSSDDPGVSVYKTMQAIGAQCGVDDCRPHRLRDTFAVRKLLAGLQIGDVSRLLGHSSVTITEKYYAKWVPGRKARLERLLADTIVDP